MNEKEEKKKEKEVQFNESEPEHKGVQQEILPERVDTQTRNSWLNTVDPWTCQWIKKVIDQGDEECAIKQTLTTRYSAWVRR